MPPDLFSSSMGFGIGVSGDWSKYLSAGRLLGLSSISDIYVSIMKSNRIKEAIIKRFMLEKEFRVKNIEDALKALDRITQISVKSDGIILVSVIYKNKNLAADIANSYIEELDKFNKETAMTVGKKYRLFIEKRLKETTDSLIYAENELEKFLKENKIAALDAEVPSVISTVAKLKSEIVLKEIQRDALLATATLDNPYLRKMEQELAEYKRRLAKIEKGSNINKNEFGVGFAVPFAEIPKISLEYTRLLRNVKIQQAIYELLTQQYEQAKIMELKDTPTVQILDQARPPLRKSWPRRAYLIIMTLIVGFIIFNFAALINESLLYIKNDPKQWQQWMEMWNGIKEDYRWLKNKILRVFYPPK